MYGHFSTLPDPLPGSIPLMMSQPRARRRRRRHVPHADRPAEAVDRRNARERRRVNDVNAAFLQLQVHLPSCKNDDGASEGEHSSSSGSGNSNQKRISKIKILHDAIDYIAQLTSILNLSAYSTVLNGHSLPGTGGGYVDLLQGGAVGQECHRKGDPGEQEVGYPKQTMTYEELENNMANLTPLEVSEDFRSHHFYQGHYSFSQDHSSYHNQQPPSAMTSITMCRPRQPSLQAQSDWPTCFLNL